MPVLSLARQMALPLTLGSVLALALALPLALPPALALLLVWIPGLHPGTPTSDQPRLLRSHYLTIPSSPALPPRFEPRTLLAMMLGAASLNPLRLMTARLRQLPRRCPARLLLPGGPRAVPLTVSVLSLRLPSAVWVFFKVPPALHGELEALRSCGGCGQGVAWCRVPRGLLLSTSLRHPVGSLGRPPGSGGAPLASGTARWPAVPSHRFLRTGVSPTRPPLPCQGGGASIVASKTLWK